MGFLHLQSKTPQAKQRLAVVFALVLTVCVALIEILFYKNPYEVDVRANSMNPVEDFPGFLSNAKESADTFVSPLENQFLIQ